MTATLELSFWRATLIDMTFEGWSTYAQNTDDTVGPMPEH
jgi:hypothetical protein